MKRPFVSLAIFLLALAGLFGWAHSSNHEGHSGNFVIGVWYEVVVNRGGVSQPLDGLLVKVNDDWIVLAKVCASANDISTGNILLTNIPYIGRWFKHTKRVETMCRDCRWIPRRAARVVSQSNSVAANVRAELRPPLGTLGKYISVYSAINGEASPVGIKNDFTTNEERTINRIIAFLNRVGIDDGMPGPQDRCFDCQANLLYVESQVDLTSAEIKLAKAN